VTTLKVGANITMKNTGTEMTHYPKTIETVARWTWGDDWHQGLSDNTESNRTALVTALLDAITPQIIADAVKAEREACNDELRLAVAAADRAGWERASKVAGAIASRAVLYPVDRPGYETIEDMLASHLAAQQSALRSYPGANGDLLKAMSMMIVQLQSVISGARGRLEANAMQIAFLPYTPPKEGEA
jgi:hypothetical protein